MLFFNFFWKMLESCKAIIDAAIKITASVNEIRVNIKEDFALPIDLNASLNQNITIMYFVVLLLKAKNFN